MRCWELSHAVTAPRLVKHEPIATPCQPSSPPLSRWWCRCFPGCSGVVGWLSSSFHSVPHRLPVQPLSSVNWQLKRDLAALRLGSKHIIFSVRLSTLVVPGLLKKLLYAVILCYFVKKTLALVRESTQNILELFKKLSFHTVTLQLFIHNFQLFI